jgi:hypothetical protein
MLTTSVGNVHCEARLTLRYLRFLASKEQTPRAFDFSAAASGHVSRN